MQTTQTHIAHTVQALRAISEVRVYESMPATSNERRGTHQATDTRTELEAWARRAAHANGFGDAGF